MQRNDWVGFKGKIFNVKFNACRCMSCKQESFCWQVGIGASDISNVLLTVPFGMNASRLCNIDLKCSFLIISFFGPSGSLRIYYSIAHPQWCFIFKTTERYWSLLDKFWSTKLYSVHNWKKGKKTKIHCHYEQMSTVFTQWSHNGEINIKSLKATGSLQKQLQNRRWAVKRHLLLVLFSTQRTTQN